MPGIGSVADLISLLIKTVKPEELERIKTDIRKLEEYHLERKKKRLAAVVAGDIATLNALLFSDEL